MLMKERADPNERVRFVIALKQRNLAQLDALFWAVSTPGSPQYREARTFPPKFNLNNPI